ncbi:head completion/stabilization protein [Phytopseudomonas daroniae]|uniref:head completion/stabilization protein n=1 Tax=Phytopseudomonas daroniae TaxID=2487519 RepID=UPI0010385587|nr:head completion/stabilization protein [Pseudomonas daroniae]TBU70999.1 head completion/stabilization protein [Pseudomonas daroniae]
MSGFIAGGTPQSGHINTDPFWPSIDLDAMRGALRIDGSVTPARLETAVIAAAISINRELLTWRTAQIAAGHETLAAVPASQINGESELVHLYARAIQAASGAEVCERYRSYDTTASGDKKAENLQDNIDDYRRDQRWAIRDLLGIRRTTVELI